MSQGQLRALLGYLRRTADPLGGDAGDAPLLERWRKQRDPAAFELLVWRHGTMVWNVCRRILVREQDLEDAFQATFLTLLRKADTIGEARFLASWLYKVAYRTALAAQDASAKRTADAPLDGDFPDPAVSTADGWDELKVVLDEELNRLPEKYRRPVVLCYLEGKTTDEAAQELDCPRGTVGTRLAWARERLRERLTQRGLALAAAGLATLLVEKASVASVPSSLVTSTAQAVTFSAAGNAVAAGVLTARAAALSQEVLHSLFMTRVKAFGAVLIAVGILTSGTGLFAHQALTTKGDQAPTVAAIQTPPAWTKPSIPPNNETPDVPNQETPVPPVKIESEFPTRYSGTVVRVDHDGNTLSLEIGPKLEPRTVEIKLTDRSQIVFTNVAANEARLTEGHAADVWLERGSNDVAARVQLRGTQNPKNSPHRTGQVSGVTPDGMGIVIESPGKGKPADRTAVRFTDKTRIRFSNVGRDEARVVVGYQTQVWRDDESADIAKVATFSGTAESKPELSKDLKPDRAGKIVGISGSGTVLTLEGQPARIAKSAKFEVKLTETTRESYYGVAVDGARPAFGDAVQVWFVEGSQDTAGRVRFTRSDPRKNVDARIVAVSSDGTRFTVEVPPESKFGEPTKWEIQTTPKTWLVFSNVGAGSARLTKGYHVRGWLVEGSEDTADELILTGLETPDGRSPK